MAYHECANELISAIRNLTDQRSNWRCAYAAYQTANGKREAGGGISADLETDQRLTEYNQQAAITIAAHKRVMRAMHEYNDQIADFDTRASELLGKHAPDTDTANVWIARQDSSGEPHYLVGLLAPYRGYKRERTDSELIALHGARREVYGDFAELAQHRTLHAAKIRARALYGYVKVHAAAAEHLGEGFSVIEG